MTIIDVLYAIFGVVVVGTLVLLCGILGGIAIAKITNQLCDEAFNDGERREGE